MDVSVLFDYVFVFKVTQLINSPNKVCFLLLNADKLVLSEKLTIKG